MNDKVVEFLQTNKDKHQKDDLIAELKKAGYCDEDIEEGVSDVYGKILSQSLESTYNDTHDISSVQSGFKRLLPILWRIIVIISIILLLLFGGCFLVFSVGNI